MKEEKRLKKTNTAEAFGQPTMAGRVGRSRSSRKSLARYVIFMPAMILYYEVVLRLVTGLPFADVGVAYTLLFSLAAGGFLSLILGLVKPRVRGGIIWIITIFCAIFYGSQFFYYSIFGTFYTFYSMLHGGEAFQFYETILSTFAKDWLPLLLFFIPLILVASTGKFRKKWPVFSGKQKIILLLAVIVLQGVSVYSVWLDKGEGLNSNILYFESGDAANSVSRFGAMTAMRLDIQKTIFPPSDSAYGQDDSDRGHDAAKNGIPSSLFDKQVLNLDFEKLIENAPNDTIKALDKYFASVTPTNKNAKTGKFKGYNLIMITAEGFSPYVLDKKLTPTLYKMATEGYQFTNFYNPIWGVSTSDGEYVECTGLLPKAGVWSFKESAKNDLPFTMGNQFRFLGLTPRAYHDHTYSYYDRDLSHPNAGYRYEGVGNGLQVKKTWPESDLEMMEKTIDDYIGDPYFHTYYMTVSGHLNYTFTGNMMAAKHRSEVADLPYSEHCKAYIACNMEFDRAMEYLLKRLDEAGIADKTLIVFSNDHYPYGLTESEQLELAGLDKFSPTYEMYRSRLVVWSGDMKGDSGKVIDKICSQADIIPTVSNLLGLPFDSRMLAGTDIFSDSEGLVIFKDYSWQTDKGIYIAPERKFYPAAGVKVDSNYIARMTKRVRNTFWASSKILETNYYRTILTKQQKNILDDPIPLP